MKLACLIDTEDAQARDLNGVFPLATSNGKQAG